MPIGKSTLKAYNAVMQAPCPKKVKGYDIVIWLDEDGDAVVTPYTPEGITFIRFLFPMWDTFDRVFIIGSPENFFRQVPNSLCVGTINPHDPEMITTVIKNTLQ